MPDEISHNKPTGFYIAEMDVGDFHDLLSGEPYRTREEAEKKLKALEDNPRCEIPLYIVEVKA